MRRAAISILDRNSKREGLLTRCFRIVLVLLLLVFAWQCRHGWPVSSSLLDLIPPANGDAVQRLAETRIQEPLQHQVIALVGAPERDRAAELARGVGHLWQHSGLFANVQVDVEVNIDALRQQLLAQRLSMIPATARQQLMNDPASYAARRVRQLADPFSGHGIVPADQDLLGLAGLAEAAMKPPGNVNYDMNTGTLLTQHDGKSWVLVRAQTSGDAFNQASPGELAKAIDDARKSVAEGGGELLVTGGPLYAAAGRSQAAGESSLIGSGAILGIIAVLLLALRRWRALLAFVPVAVGLLFGLVACVALFGTIHILTLVIGASLIGIAIHFPLHLLAVSYGGPGWRAWPALHRVLPGLTISLGVTLVGYLALVFTPFPALTQTAVFSAAGLLGAYACTVCELPNWLRDWQPRPVRPLLVMALALLSTLSRWTARRSLPWLAGGVALICISGILQLRTLDDLRQWLSLPPPLLAQAREIGDITGIMPTSQFYLVRAASVDDLWERQNELGKRLDALVHAKSLSSYLSLNQLVAPAAAQEALREKLRDPSWRARISPSFETIGVPSQLLMADIDALAALPPVDMTTVLDGPLGESRRSLWLGRQDGQYAAIVTLQGLHDVGAAAAAAQGLEGTAFVDSTGDLNRTFAGTRIKAAELKLMSYLVAAALLWATLGRAATWRLLAVPLAATVCTLASLGFLGQPLTLFSLFGLLLVSAIGLDYAIVMHERIAGAGASLVGVLLAAATTMLSFGLLALSSTPAISNFGIAVGLGVAFSVLFAPWVRPTREDAGTVKR